MTRDRWSLVWIDAREARIVTWADDEARLERLESEVPAHRASTGHVRHDPLVRHGGGGTPQTAGEPHRLEHIARFVDEVAARIGDAGGVKVVGPGETRERLTDVLRARDQRRSLSRSVTTEAADPLTDRQLIARVRELAGVPAPRRQVGGRRDLAGGSGRTHA